jgi:hypothetical protein
LLKAAKLVASWKEAEGEAAEMKGCGRKLLGKNEQNGRFKENNCYVILLVHQATLTWASLFGNRSLDDE